MFLKSFFICFFVLLFFFNLFVALVGEKEISRNSGNSRIAIPTISLESEICSSSRDVCLDGGVWMKYRDERYNFILTGHSFTILPLRAGIFYGLGEIEVGEKIFLDLEERFVYEVYEVFVVDRFDLEVENLGNFEKTLVLYSCYPQWSASKRIVVRAKLCDSCENEM